MSSEEDDDLKSLRSALLKSIRAKQSPSNDINSAADNCDADFEDLEALRQAALRSVTINKPNQVSTNMTNGNAHLFGLQLPCTSSQNFKFAGRSGIGTNRFPCFTNARSNLIVIQTVPNECDSLPVSNCKQLSPPPKLVLPQDRYANFSALNKRAERNRRKRTDKFARIEESSSSSSEEEDLFINANAVDHRHQTVSDDELSRADTGTPLADEKSDLSVDGDNHSNIMHFDSNSNLSPIKLPNSSVLAADKTYKSKMETEDFDLPEPEVELIGFDDDGSLYQAKNISDSRSNLCNAANGGGDVSSDEQYELVDECTDDEDVEEQSAINVLPERSKGPQVTTVHNLSSSSKTKQTRKKRRSVYAAAAKRSKPGREDSKLDYRHSGRRLMSAVYTTSAKRIAFN